MDRLNIEYPNAFSVNNEIRYTHLSHMDIGSISLGGGLLLVKETHGTVSVNQNKEWPSWSDLPLLSTHAQIGSCLRVISP